MQISPMPFKQGNLYTLLLEMYNEVNTSNAVEYLQCL